MIAILTKYEALVDRVKDEYRGKPVSKRDVLNYTKKNILDPLTNGKHAPEAIIQIHRELFIGI